MRRWDRAVVDGVELKYLTRGAGELIVLVYVGMFGDQGLRTCDADQ